MSSTSVAIEDVTAIKERSLIATILANQAFWVSVAVALICLATAWEQPDTFATKANFFNVTRNTVSYEILETYKVGQQPAVTAAARAGQASGKASGKGVAK